MPLIAWMFEVEPPAGWRELPDPTRLVFRGPEDEELIASAAVAEGATEAARDAAVDRLFDAAVQATADAARRPTLRVTRELSPAAIRPPLAVWTLDAITEAGDVRFQAAVVRAPGGVLALTLECAESPHASCVFWRILDAVELVAPPARA